MLELRGLACVRGGEVVFRGVAAGLAPGRALHVTGANGRGKTSLLRIIAGLLAPARGQVLWFGRPVGAANGAVATGLEREQFLNSLTYLGHQPALKPDLTPLENLLAARALRGSPIGKAAASAALAEAGLSDQRDMPVRRLSQGQVRRSALAALWALVPGQGLWLLDEPFNALDAAASEALAGLINRHVQAGGLTVFTAHQPVGLAVPVHTLNLV